MMIMRYENHCVVKPLCYYRNQIRKNLLNAKCKIGAKHANKLLLKSVAHKQHFEHSCEDSIANLKIWIIRVSPKNPFDWEFLKIVSVIIYSFVKNCSNLRVFWPIPCRSLYIAKYSRRMDAGMLKFFPRV